MQSVFTRSKFVAMGAVGLSLALAQAAQAASATWLGTTDSTWSGANWSDPTPPGSGEAATFNGAGNGNTTIDLGAGVTVGSITFDTAIAAGYTVGAGVVGSQSLTFNTASGGNALVLTSTAANDQTINANILANTADNTLRIQNDSTTNTLTVNGTIQGGSGSPARTINVDGVGTTHLNGAINKGSASNIDLANLGMGTVILDGTGSSTFGTLRSNLGGYGSGGILVDGQNVTVSNDSRYGGSGTTRGKFEIKSGSVSFNGGVGSYKSGDGSLIKVSGGTFNASTVYLSRSASYSSQPSSVNNSSGFVVTGGTATITGALSIGTLDTNSSAGSLVSGGSLTVGGAVNIGNTTTGRWNALEVRGGTFTSTDTTNGVVLSVHGSTNNNSILLLTGGTSTIERIAFGRAASATNSKGVLSLDGAGAELYLGSGGIVLDAVNPYTATIDLTKGTLAAKADWSSSLPMNLKGSGVTIKAADASDSGHNITLNGALSGANGFIKTGDGTLTLGGVNTYTGSTSVNDGTLALSSTGALTFVIGATGVNNSILGTGGASLDGVFNLDLTGAGTTMGDSWQLVGSGLSASYGSNFGIAGFTPAGALWNGSANGADYQFNEATGVLSVVPEPGSALLVALGGAMMMVRRRRSA